MMTFRTVNVRDRFILLLSLLIVLWAVPAFAATIWVDSNRGTADPVNYCRDPQAECTLHAAVDLAHDLTGTVYIAFKPNVGTISLAAPLIIKRDITFLGPARGMQTLDVGYGLIAQIDDDADVVFRRIKVTNADGNAGDINYAGGAFSVVSTSASLKIYDSSIDRTKSGIHGGAIYSIGLLHLDNVTITRTTALGDGGAIYFDGPSRSFQANKLYIRDNVTAIGNGGCIFVGRSLSGQSSLNAQITNSSLEACSAGEDGGGLYLESNVSLVNTTIAGNDADRNGGGIFYTDNVTSEPDENRVNENLTIYGNTAGNYGGGVFIGAINSSLTGTLFSFHNATIAENSAGINGGGIFHYDDMAVRISASAIFKNIAGDFQDIAGEVFLCGQNYLYDDSEVVTLPCVTNGHTDNGSIWSDALRNEPNVTPLQDNGGDVKTLLPKYGSLMLDNVTVDLATDTDARGVARPQGAKPDLGAVEASHGIEIFPGPTYDFGTVEIGIGKRKRFLVVNSGESATTITTVDITDSDGNAFTFASNTCDSRVLSPGGSCTFTILFNPPTAESYNGLVTATTVVSEQASVVLTGQGKYGAASTQPMSVIYTAEDAEGDNATIRITNTSDVPLVIDLTSILGDNSSAFQIIGDTCNSNVLDAGLDCTITVQFVGTGMDDQNGYLSIATSDPNNEDIQVTLLRSYRVTDKGLCGGESGGCSAGASGGVPLVLLAGLAYLARRAGRRWRI